MKMRELQKKGVKGTAQVHQNGNGFGTREPDGSGTSGGHADEASATKAFEQHLAKKMKDGWTETEASLSRRVFFHSGNTPGKFWIVWLDGDFLGVQYGKEPKHASWWSPHTGQNKKKEFPDREKALKEYERSIGEKLAEGYEERYARATDYSELGKALAERKKAAPKTERVKKSKPAAENVAAVLEKEERPVHLEVTRQIDLDAQDWFQATWKPWTPLTRPKPEPFDLEACVARVSKVKSNTQHDWIERLGIPESMTREEAHFWFMLLTSLLQGVGSPAEEAAKLAKKTWDGKIDLQGVRKRKPSFWGSVVRCLSFLLPARDIVGLWLEQEPSEWGQDLVRDHVFAYLKEPELKALRKHVAAQIDLNVQPKSQHYNSYPQAFFIGNLLGCHAEMRALVASWQPDPPNAWITFNHPPMFVLGLGDPSLTESEFRRLKLKWWRAEELRGWLAVTEIRALDVARDAVLQAQNKRHCEQFLDVFVKVRAPEAAVHMLELSLSAKSPALAKDWLQTEVGNSIAGLVSVAAGQGKLPEAAMAYLQDRKRDGRAALIESALKNQPSDVVTKIRSAVLDREETVLAAFTSANTPPRLAKACAAASSRAPLGGSNFVTIAKLPPIAVGKHRLNPEQVAAVLLALQYAEFGKPDELLSALKQHATAESLDAFAWALPGEWVDAGASPKHKWAMRAIGFLGSDALAIRLTPLIRAWPGESQHPRAVLGLECLRAIGTDTALMQLNGIAVKSKFKAIQIKAREMMEAVAREKGLTSSQLEDRIVPDCDLDERGSREFDFGTRQFRFVLGPGLKPAVKLPDGSVKDDLPKPGAKDDAEKAKAAIDEWKLLKKQVKDVAAIQAARLEQTMVTGRRWPIVEFETMLLNHPLMTNLIRLVLWGGYDAKGKLTVFRITEDRGFADAMDKPFKLDGIDAVGIVHPLHLDESQKSAWGELFSDYEIVPLFPQLNRPTYRFTDDELRTDEIKRFAGVKIPVATLAFGLEKLGWRRGDAQDNGQVNGHSKHFPANDLSAIVIYEDGFPVGYRDGWEDQRITDVYFVPGPHTVTWGRRWSKGTKTIPLKKLDPVIASEVLGDLTGLAAKGKEG